MTSSAPQLLPVHIDYDGPAPIDTYFTTSKDEKGNKIAAFRGRSLYGVDLGLPDGYTGAVLSAEGGKDGKTRLTAVSTFSEVGLWRADLPVDLKSDEYARALDEWTRMAVLVHTPDEDED